MCFKNMGCIILDFALVLMGRKSQNASLAYFRKCFSQLSFIIGLLAGLLFGQGVLAQAPDQMNQFLALDRAHRPGLVVSSLRQMVLAILNQVDGHSFTAHQFVGYSGASYLDLAKYKKDFEARAIELDADTKKMSGSEAMTVFILGASTDGFGVAYQILDDLKKSGRLKNILVAGMASDEAISYHLEGLVKGWGDVISPLQDIVYFRKTYTNEQGKRSWELKSSPEGESDTPKVLKNLSRFANAGVMTFNVFGGGIQAFNETMEMVLESRSRPQRVQIQLFVGHSAGKTKKDTGYRAADMLAYILQKNAFLLNDKIDVHVRFFDGRTILVQNFANTPEFNQIQFDIATAAAKIAELKMAQLTPEIQAQINYYEVLNGLTKLPLEEIEKFRIRSSRNLSEARAKLTIDTNGSESFFDKATEGHADLCLTCLQDIEAIRDNYLRSKSCTKQFNHK